MSDDDIDNMDFDLPPELIENKVPINPFTADINIPGMNSGPFANMMDKMPKPLDYAPPEMSEEELKETKNWVCIYPVYLDISKTRTEGRRVGKKDGIKDPSAIYIVKAAKLLGYKVGFEPLKRHSRDPFNYGRIRIKFKDGNQYLLPNITTKSQLYSAVASKVPEAKELLQDLDGKIEKYAQYARGIISKDFKAE